MKNELSQVSSLRNENIFQKEITKSFIKSQTLDPETLTEIKKLDYRLWKSLLTRKHLFFVFNDQACSSCILKVFQDLDYLSQEIDKTRIVVFTDIIFENLESPLNPNHYGFKQIKISTLDLEVDKLNQPYLFIYHPENQINQLLIPDLFDDYRSEYFANYLNILKQ